MLKYKSFEFRRELKFGDKIIYETSKGIKVSCVYEVISQEVYEESGETKIHIKYKDINGEVCEWHSDNNECYVFYIEEEEENRLLDNTAIEIPKGRDEEIDDCCMRCMTDLSKSGIRVMSNFCYILPTSDWRVNFKLMFSNKDLGTFKIMEDLRTDMYFKRLVRAILRYYTNFYAIVFPTEAEGYLFKNKLMLFKTRESFRYVESLISQNTRVEAIDLSTKQIIQLPAEVEDDVLKCQGDSCKLVDILNNKQDTCLESSIWVPVENKRTKFLYTSAVSKEKHLEIRVYF